MLENKDKLKNQAISDDEIEAVSGGDTLTVIHNGVRVVLEYSCPKCGCKDLKGLSDGATYDRQTNFYEDVTNHLVKCSNCGYTAIGGKFRIEKKSIENI